jgi:predicted membrane protein
MSMTVLLADSNNLITALTQGIVDVSGGDMMLLGLVFIIVIGLFLMMTNARSGLVIVIAMALIFMLSLVNPLFMALYWVALAISIVLVVIGLKEKSRS